MPISPEEPTRRLAAADTARLQLRRATRELRALGSELLAGRNTDVTPDRPQRSDRRPAGGPGVTRAPKVVRAAFDDDAVIVYQAYSPVIAEEALRLGTFGPAFSLGRMTWIKPSFGWMLYRAGYGRKPGQERVLRIAISHGGFRAALAAAVPSSFQSHLYPDREAWSAALHASPVRYQWDPDRDLRLVALPRRAIQIGIAGDMVRRYVADWIRRIEDVTGLAHAVEAGQSPPVPDERPYPLDPATLGSLGCTDEAPAI